MPLLSRLYWNINNLTDYLGTIYSVTDAKSVNLTVCV